MRNVVCKGYALHLMGRDGIPLKLGSVYSSILPVYKSLDSGKNGYSSKSAQDITEEFGAVGAVALTLLHSNLAKSMGRATPQECGWDFKREDWQAFCEGKDPRRLSLLYSDTLATYYGLPCIARGDEDLFPGRPAIAVGLDSGGSWAVELSTGPVVQGEGTDEEYKAVYTNDGFGEWVWNPDTWQFEVGGWRGPLALLFYTLK